DPCPPCPAASPPSPPAHARPKGRLPVRWAEWAAPGRGQPLFTPYQPGFYYLVSAVHVLVPSLTNAIVIAATLLWWGGAAAMAVVFRRLGTWPALAAAALFATAPYLVLDVYVRMADRKSTRLNSSHVKISYAVF